MSFFQQDWEDDEVDESEEGDGAINFILLMSLVVFGILLALKFLPYA